MDVVGDGLDAGNFTVVLFLLSLMELFLFWFEFVQDEQVSLRYWNSELAHQILLLDFLKSFSAN